MGTSPTIFTIGHSTHAIAAFLGLLSRHGVTAVADVRSQPYSRLAHFSRNGLEAALKAQGIQYVFLGRELGARREEQECYLGGKVVYERIAALPLFQDGLQRLARGAEKYTLAVMCAEKEPLDCHRTVIISRHLQRMGFRIAHILADGTLEDHQQTEKRLVELMGANRDLFRPENGDVDMVGHAYVTRGEEIAYQLSEEDSRRDRA